jgi:GAF domain-containing protein
LRGLEIVCRQPWIRFYCGIPLVANGQTRGAIAVIDRAPQELAIEQHWALRQLADLAASLLARN